MAKEDKVRGTNIVQFIIKLKQAKTHCENVAAICPENTGGHKHFKRQIKRLDDIFTDTASITILSEEVRAAMRKEWNSDEFTIEAIYEKLALLPPEQKEKVETLVDMILAGEKIELIEYEPTES